MSQKPVMTRPSGLRIVEINLKSAELRRSRAAKISVTMWRNTERMLKTEPKFRLSDSDLVLNQKYVFSVPQSALHGRDPWVYFNIHKKSFYKDSLLGTAALDLGSCFEEKGDIASDELGMGATVYDEEVWGDYDFGQDPRFENLFESSKNDEEEDEQDHEQEEKSGRWKKTSLKIMKGSNTIGKLNVEVCLWEGSLSCVGGRDCWDLAMSYDEFMALINMRNSRKTKSSLFGCFNAATAL